MAEMLTIARPYAEAAFQAALEARDLPSWSGAIERLAAVARDPQLQNLIGDPNLTPAQMSDLLAGVAGDLSREQRNFVTLLADNERVAALPQIAELFSELRHRHEQVLEAHVTSAFDLTEAQKNELRATLEARYGHKVDLRVGTDPELIGGVTIRIGDEVTDTSVRGKLAQLHTALLSQ